MIRLTFNALVACCWLLSAQVLAVLITEAKRDSNSKKLIVFFGFLIARTAPTAFKAIDQYHYNKIIK